MLLLDTHAFVWLASDQDQLPRRSRELIKKHAGELHVSAISALEIAILVKRSKLKLPVAADVFIEKTLAQHGIEEIPVTRDIACLSAALPDIHNDPFDRIMIATAKLRKLTIVSKDRNISRYPNTTVIWE
ncbi:MAG: PIN domain nuclease [Verrucomicrobia bacterium]|nr:PIN domain nuclease [Verrucomicrobiota bacterium]